MKSLFVTKCGKQMTSSSSNRHKQIAVAAVLSDMGTGEQGCFSAYFQISTFCDRTIKNWSCCQSSQPP